MTWDSKPREQLERLADYLNALDAVDENSDEVPVVDQMIELHDDYRKMAWLGEQARRALMNLECEVTGKCCAFTDDGDARLKCCNPCRVWQKALFPRGEAPRPLPPEGPPTLSLVPDPG